MDNKLRATIQNEAGSQGLAVDEGFYRRLDEYIERFFGSRPSNEKLIIQTYLARGGLRIAKTERKRIVEAEDAKAAIWLFHLPEHPDDPCTEAGNRALLEESKRLKYTKGLLVESFSKILDQTR